MSRSISAGDPFGGSERNLYIKTFSHHAFHMRTTLDLPDPLFKEVKTRAVQLKDLAA